LSSTRVLCKVKQAQKALQFKFSGSNKTRVSTSRVLAEGSSMTYTRVEGRHRFSCARKP